MKTSLLFAVCLATAFGGTILAQPAYFTRITDGPIATDAEISWGCSLADYDNDGLADVFVANWLGCTNSLYHNDGNFQFSRIRIGAPAETSAGVWGDWDNDGDLDLFLSNYQPNKSDLYRNDLTEPGHSTFTRITKGTSVAASVGAAWGDYDNDGFLELAVANSGDPAQSEFLYRNDGAGGMVRVNAPPLTSSGGRSQNCSWADYDNDGDLDLYVANGYAQQNFLFRNEGGGAFSRVTQGRLVTTAANWSAPAWADYDNDGDLDLYVSAHSGSRNALFRNDSDGTFTTVEDDPVVTQYANSGGVAWGDFDNDGYLDLFVANMDLERDFLFHNQRDGSFAQILDGEMVNDEAYAAGCAWADMDNDGFLDLFVANQGESMNMSTAQPNFLYRNDAKANGNTNGWLLVRLVGVASNRSAIGAKVRVKATLWGKGVWQMREISGGSGLCSQNDLRAHFGLGDAAQVDLLRIEWPSGIVQEIAKVQGRQILTVTEDQGCVFLPPSLSASKSFDGTVQLTAAGPANFPYVFEASTNLSQWSKIGVRTNVTGTVVFTDSAANIIPQRFYRVLLPGALGDCSKTAL